MLFDIQHHRVKQFSRPLNTTLLMISKHPITDDPKTQCILIDACCAAVGASKLCRTQSPKDFDLNPPQPSCVPNTISSPFSLCCID